MLACKAETGESACAGGVSEVTALRPQPWVSLFSEPAACSHEPLKDIEQQSKEGQNLDVWSCHVWHNSWPHA